MAPKKSISPAASASASSADEIPIVEVTPSDAAPPPPAAEQDLGARFTQVLERLQTYALGLRELTVSVKALQKDVLKLQKQKEGRRARRPAAASGSDASTEARKPSGFAKPTLLTNELCEFLGVPNDSRLARTEVTRLITKYVKENKLHDDQDKRIIRPDGKLQQLLGLQDGQELTYFNLQAFIKKHFIKDAPAAVASA